MVTCSHESKHLVGLCDWSHEMLNLSELYDFVFQCSGCGCALRWIPCYDRDNLSLYKNIEELTVEMERWSIVRLFNV